MRKIILNDQITVTFFALIQRLIYESDATSYVEFGGSGTLFKYPSKSKLLITDKHPSSNCARGEVLVDFDGSFELNQKYEHAICINSIYYAKLPVESLNRIINSVSDGGSLTFSVPWIYPHHDLELPQWRIHPAVFQEILTSHFKVIDYYMVGSAKSLLIIYLNRFLRKYHLIGSHIDLLKLEQTRQHINMSQFKSSRIFVERHKPLWYVFNCKVKF